jgi:hypothetical protein
MNTLVEADGLEEKVKVCDLPCLPHLHDATSVVASAP